MPGYAATLKDIYGTIENMEAAIAEQKADEARERDWWYLESLSNVEREAEMERRMDDHGPEWTHCSRCYSDYFDADGNPL